MLTIETVAEIAADGTLTARAPASAPRGKRRVVIVLEDDAVVETAGPTPRRLPDLAAFREQWGGKPYPGNSAVDLRTRAFQAPRQPAPAPSEPAAPGQ